MEEKRRFPQVSPAPVPLPSKGPRVPCKVLLRRRTRRKGVLRAVVRGTTHGATAGGPGRHGDRWRWPGTAEQGPTGRVASSLLTPAADPDGEIQRQVKRHILRVNCHLTQNHLQKEFVGSAAGELTGSEGLGTASGTRN